MKEIFKFTEEYLKKKGLKSKGMFICPKCNKPTATIRPVIDFTMFCMICQRIGNLFDIVKLIEKEYKDSSDDNIESYIKELLNLDIVTESDINRALNFYKDNEFDLVPIVKNGKYPIEKEWQKKEHKNKDEWVEWLKNDLNLGIKTGKCSNITVIDFDSKIPEELSKVNTLKQKTKNGWHYFFKYEEDLPKTRIVNLKIDIETDGGQVVVFPSIVEECNREIFKEKVIEMPKDWKDFFLSKVTKKPNFNLEESKVKLEDNFKEDLIKEGERHHIIMKFGGVIRRKLNMYDTSFVLDMVNKRLTNPQLSPYEFSNVLKSLEKYTSYDDMEITQKILHYLRIVEEATERDIREALEFKKAKIDSALSYLVKEEQIIKKRRMFHILKKVEWKESWMGECVEIDFKMPYFHDCAVFRNGDMLVIGGKNKMGKSHLALNIIKRLVKQNIKPYYVSLESGNRFASISQSLGLKEGDYKYTIESDPDNIELEKNVITIIDWLLPKDYASVDKIFAHLSKQLVKNGGILIVFVQLKMDGEFFAANMLGMFPAFICKYLYTDENDGSKGYFLVETMRESKTKRKKVVIPCEYHYFSKELNRVDGL